MGLVVAAADVLLPLAEAPAATPGQAETSPDGTFASLLASLSAEQTPVEGKGLEDIAKLALPAEDKPETDPFAAILAMALPLQLPVPPPVTQAEPGSVDSEGEGPGATTGAATASPEALASLESAATPSTEAVAPTPPNAAPAPGVVSTAADAVATPQAVAQTPEAIIAAATPPPLEQAPAGRTTAPPGSDVAGPEPGAPPPGTEATSVVRSVGNAETNPDSNGDASSDSKERQETALPKASANGIANAAPSSAAGQLQQPSGAASIETAPVEAPAPAAELPQQVEQVAHTVIERVEAGGGEARIHLDPGDMGEVTIHVRADGDAVRVDIRAERQEALNLLRDHTQDLSSLLGERGLNLSDVNVGLGRGNSDQTWAQDSRPETRPAAGEFASILGLDDGSPIELHQRLRAAYNPDGAHLFRV